MRKPNEGQSDSRNVPPDSPAVVSKERFGSDSGQGPLAGALPGWDLLPATQFVRRR